MAAEEERILKIKKAFLEYAKRNELSAFVTPYYLAKQFLPEESLFLKMEVIQNLINVGIVKIIKEKWIITNTGYQSLCSIQK
jgi:uncharacterized protein affecting Mg2+/Co2+ transport